MQRIECIINFYFDDNVNAPSPPQPVPAINCSTTDHFSKHILWGALWHVHCNYFGLDIYIHMWKYVYIVMLNIETVQDRTRK